MEEDLAPTSVELAVVPRDSRDVARQAVRVAVGTTLAVVAVTANALQRSRSLSGAIQRRADPSPLTLVPGAVLGLSLSGARRATALATRAFDTVGTPVVRAIAPALRPLEEPLRRALADSERKWRAAEVESMQAAAAFVRELEPQIVRAVLEPLDLTTLVGENVDRRCNRRGSVRERRCRPGCRSYGRSHHSPAEATPGCSGRARVDQPHERIGTLVTEVLPARARAFQGLRSGPVSRTLASIVDVSVVALATVGVVLGWSLIESLGDRAFELSIPGPLGAFVLGESLLVIYLWVGWTTTGRTIGKQVMGLRVVNHRGELMRPGWALLRALACVVFPIGLLWSLASSHNRSLQDVALRTSVIYDWNARLPARSPRRARVGDGGDDDRR